MEAIPALGSRRMGECTVELTDHQPEEYVMPWMEGVSMLLTQFSRKLNDSESSSVSESDSEIENEMDQIDDV